MFPVFILLLAGGQMLALRPFVGGWQWFGYSLAGFVAAIMVGQPLLGVLDPLGLNELAALTIAHAVGGAAVGFAQWFVLRRRVAAAWCWIPLQMLLWGGLILAWYPLFDTVWIPGRVPVGFEGDHELRQLVRVTASAALLSAPVLLWLLRQREPERDPTLVSGHLPG